MCSGKMWVWVVRFLWNVGHMLPFEPETTSKVRYWYYTVWSQCILHLYHIHGYHKNKKIKKKTVMKFNFMFRYEDCRSCYVSSLNDNLQCNTPRVYTSSCYVSSLNDNLQCNTPRVYTSSCYVSSLNDNLQCNTPRVYTRSCYVSSLNDNL